jgi:methylated-DNA-[protein]-cysteine S-methyltransferase
MMKLTVPTTAGDFVAHYSERGLARLNFPTSSGAHARSENGDIKPSAEMRRWHGLTMAALKEILGGRKPRNLPPLDLSSGTEFQQRVWRAMLEIDFGRTLSYGEIAAKIGKPKATRAVGGACGANPIPVLVPCHRVLAANQRLGGFSSGLDWKRKLLAIEYVSPAE